LKRTTKHSGPGITAKIGEKRIDLEDLMVKVETGLKSRIGYRGWLRFRFEATKQHSEGRIQTKLWIIDAIGNEHGVTTADEHELEPTEGEMTY
jgi:hypothetical protein